jgi:hypothetical protein
MDRRLKKDLVEQGILSVEDLSKVNVSRFRPNFDVPFAEYARRRDFARNQEVPAGTGSRQRVQRWRTETFESHRYQRLEEARDQSGFGQSWQPGWSTARIKIPRVNVDSLFQVLEVYNKVLLTKQKQIQQAKDEDFDKATFTKALKEYEVQTDALLKQQFKLQKEVSELHEAWVAMRAPPTYGNWNTHRDSSYI